MDCEFLEGCPIFAKFKSEGSKNLWISNYCKLNHEKCERKKLRINFESVPITLLPNGTHLKSLE